MSNGAVGDSEDEEIPPESPEVAKDPSFTVDTANRYFIGKDYSNQYQKDFETLDKFSEGTDLVLLGLFLHRRHNRLHRSKDRPTDALA
jgi:hypothetical protein